MNVRRDTGDELINLLPCNGAPLGEGHSVGIQSNRYAMRWVEHDRGPDPARLPICRPERACFNRRNERRACSAGAAPNVWAIGRAASFAGAEDEAVDAVRERRLQDRGAGDFA